jgi:effector-binding domain-containing protein
MGRKYFRFLIFFLCSVVILAVLVTLILPSTGRIVKETNIQAGRQVVFSQLSTLHNYSQWYPWIQEDPDVKIDYAANNRTMSWHKTGASRGAGTYELTGAQGDSVLRFTFSYNGAPPIQGAYILRSMGDAGGTTVVWYMNMKAGLTPWWRFYAAMMNKLAGPMMETGLTNLKILSEQADVYSDIPVKEKRIARAYVATLADTVSQSLIYPTLRRLLGRISLFMEDHELPAEGDPIAQFSELANHTYRVNAGIRVPHPFASDTDIQLLVIPAGTALMANYKGEYSGIQKAYQALSHFAAGFAKSGSTDPWEAYLDGKIPSADTSYCHVHVYYPVSHQ